MKAIGRWSRWLIAEIRQATTATPLIDRPGYQEWGWRFGAITTQSPKRVAVCADCGQRIEAGSMALHVIDTETPNGAWTPRKRFLHRVCGSPKPTP